MENKHEYPATHRMSSVLTSSMPSAAPNHLMTLVLGPLLSRRLKSWRRMGGSHESAGNQAAHPKLLQSSITSSLPAFWIKVGKIKFMTAFRPIAK
jgi:hypothetical protein